MSFYKVIGMPRMEALSASLPIGSSLAPLDFGLTPILTTNKHRELTVFFEHGSRWVFNTQSGSTLGQGGEGCVKSVSSCTIFDYSSQDTQHLIRNDLAYSFDTVGEKSVIRVDPNGIVLKKIELTSNTMIKRHLQRYQDRESKFLFVEQSFYPAQDERMRQTMPILVKRIQKAYQLTNALPDSAGKGAVFVSAPYVGTAHYGTFPRFKLMSFDNGQCKPVKVLKTIIAMKRVLGTDLFTLMRSSEAPLSIEQLVKIFLTALLTLERIHRETGIVHNDVKPTNIMVQLDPFHLQFIDLGRSYVEGFGEFPNDPVTEYFCAPEVYNPVPYSGFLSDGFSLGVTAYFMFAHQYPYENGTKGLQPLGLLPLSLLQIRLNNHYDLKKRFPTIQKMILDLIHPDPNHRTTLLNCIEIARKTLPSDILNGVGYTQVSEI